MWLAAYPAMGRQFTRDEKGVVIAGIGAARLWSNYSPELVVSLPNH
jgi:hypothetical protein